MPLTVASVEGVHNVYVDHAADKWSYEAPVLIGLGVGLLLDIALLYALGRAWSHPMT